MVSRNLEYKYFTMLTMFAVEPSTALTWQSPLSSNKNSITHFGRPGVQFGAVEDKSHDSYVDTSRGISSWLRVPAQCLNIHISQIQLNAAPRITQDMARLSSWRPRNAKDKTVLTTTMGIPTHTRNWNWGWGWHWRT